LTRASALTNRNVEEMRRLRPTMTLHELSLRYGVSRTAIWKHTRGIDGPPQVNHVANLRSAA
jgi:hypothetical protein